MADTEDAVVIESKATPEQQAAAEKTGWIPPSRYKGEPERFIDADLYLERAETVLPIVKKQLAEVRAENTGLRTDYQKTQAALKDALERLDQIEERHSVETQRAVEAAKRGLKAQLAEASEAGDHAAVAELTQQMVDLNTAEKEPPAKKKEEAKVEDSPFTPAQKAEMDAWNERNPWFGTNKRKTALAIAIAGELREAGNQKQGAAFYDDVAAEVEKTLEPAKAEPREASDKVEGARQSGEGTRAAAAGKKSYQHLSAEAKAACDADIRKFVGEGKRYKDAASYRANWANLYFEQESR